MVVIDLDPLLILIPMFVIISILGSIYYLRKTKVNRSISKSNDNSVLQHYNVLMNINEDQQAVIKSVTQKSKMLQKKITELEGFEPEEEKEPELDLRALLPIAAKLGIPQAQLELILQSEDAKKFIKKNLGTIQSVLPLIAQFAGDRSKSGQETTLPTNSA